jgi:hypothetical protein
VKFVRSTALWRRLWFALASVATHGLFVGVALYLVDWGYPSINGEVVWAGIAWLTAVLAWHLLHPGFSLQSADGVLGLQDRLMTWWSLRGRRDDPATRWLAEDLSNSLEALPAQARGQLWRRPARRLLWVLPLLVLVYWIGPIGRLQFLPSPLGVTKPDPIGPAGQGGNSGATDQVAGKGESDPKPGSGKPDPKKPDPKKPDPKRPRQKPPEQSPPPRPKDPGSGGLQPGPRPILPLPAKDEFVIPKFIGEGDGEKKKTKVAVIEETDGNAGVRPTGSARTAPPETDAAARDREFEKARERAVRARHVPERERGFVRRYFDALRREGRKLP